MHACMHYFIYFNGTNRLYNYDGMYDSQVNENASTECQQNNVTTRGQDRYIMNTHLRNGFQTATTTAANIPEFHNNRINAKTVRNRLRENGLHARRPHVGCVLTRRHRQNRLNWARVQIRWIRRRWNTGVVFFFFFFFFFGGGG